MADIYDGFVNGELDNISKYKKITADGLYSQVEEKFKCFICKNKKELDVNKFKIILKAEHDSIDHNYCLTITALSISSCAVIIGLASLITSTFNKQDMVIEVTNKLNQPYQKVGLVLGILSIIYIVLVPIFTTKTYKKSIKAYNKKKILNICLELLENYKNQD